MLTKFTTDNILLFADQNSQPYFELAKSALFEQKRKDAEELLQMEFDNFVADDIKLPKLRNLIIDIMNQCVLDLIEQGTPESEAFDLAFDSLIPDSDSELALLLQSQILEMLVEDELPDPDEIPKEIRVSYALFIIAGLLCGAFVGIILGLTSWSHNFAFAFGIFSSCGILLGLVCAVLKHALSESKKNAPVVDDTIPEPESEPDAN